jgi:hypothetical protein
MKNSHILAASIWILIVSIVIFSIGEQMVVQADENGTLNLTEEIVLEIDPTRIGQDNIIKGTLSIPFNQSLDPQEEIQINISGEISSFTIIDILENNEFNILYESVEYSAANAEPLKQLDFTGPSEKLVGIQVPRFSDVESFSFKISGKEISDSYPSNVKIDIGNEGTSDWFYIGDTSGFSEELITTPDLDESSEASGSIEDDKTYYCELINLPLGNRFKITADYSRGELSDATIHAAILSVPTGNPEWGWSGDSTCDLPNPESARRDCNIELDHPIEGEHLICLYGEYDTIPAEDSEENLFTIPLDTTATTTTSHTCPTSIGSLCQETLFSNFFIYVSESTYDNELKTQVSLDDWLTFDEAALLGAKNYVGSEPFEGICRTSICTIPINISTDTTGNISLGSLDLVYDFNDLEQSATSFYDLVLPKAYIRAIESQILDDQTTIEINFESFETTLSELGEYTIDITFLGATSNTQTINIVPADEIYDAPTLIEAGKKNFDLFLDDTSDEFQIMTMLEKTTSIQTALSELTSLETEIGFTIESILLESVQNAIGDNPWQISFSDTDSRIIGVGPSAIPPEYGDQFEIYELQNKIEVLGTKQQIEIETFDGNIDTYTFIKKEITAIEPITGAIINELATGINTYSTTPRSQSVSENVVTYELTLGVGETLTYYFLTEDVVVLEDFTTILTLGTAPTDTTTPDEIVPDRTQPDEQYEEDTGSSLFVPIIIVVIIILAIVGAVVVFKKKKGGKRVLSTRPLARPKPLKREPVRSQPQRKSEPKKPQGRKALFRK